MKRNGTDLWKFVQENEMGKGGEEERNEPVEREIGSKHRSDFVVDLRIFLSLCLSE